MEGKTIEKTRKDVDHELEASLERVTPRLPQVIREHIRTLKAPGEREEAERIWKGTLEGERKYDKEHEVRPLLHYAIDAMLDGDDPVRSIEQQVRTIWLLHAADFISEKDRFGNLVRIGEASDNNFLHPDIDGVLISARDELQKFILTNY